MSYSFDCTTKDSFLNMSIKIRDCPQNYDAANEKWKFFNLCGLSTECLLAIWPSQYQFSYEKSVQISMGFSCQTVARFKQIFWLHTQKHIR